MSHEVVQELIPAYALGAVDQDERALVVAHLDECPACRALLSDYQAVGTGLLYTVPLVAAPPGLTEDLRRRMAQPRWQTGPRRARFAFLRRPAYLALAASLILLLATNLYWSNRLAQAERQAALLAELLQAPSIPLQADSDASQASGVLHVPRRGQVALLVVRDMPPLPADKVYQLWLVRSGQRESGGLFRVNRDGSGFLLVKSPRPLQEYEAVGITAEPAGGSPGPTSPRVIGGRL
jgi:anti-sigma-K factor RskA